MEHHDGSTFERHMSIEVKERVGAMSISPSSRDIVLASRRGLLVIDLVNPYDPPRVLPHNSPWEVADVQWNVHRFKDYWVVSTSNQKAMVWNLALPSNRAIEFVLHGHSRAITDMNWSAFSPDILATCSIDSFVYTWDLREPRWPANRFCDWTSGATQVKWNRKDEHVIASSHGKFIRIWDDRFGAAPVESICTSPSLTKIYGIDFNRMSESRILSCGLDSSVKFWDYAADCDTPASTIQTNFPVWRARHTPFGYGVVLMPQRNDNSVYLYDVRETATSKPDPVVKFRGHTDQVKEFLWRVKGDTGDTYDHRSFQLVTWSNDQHVRLWPVDPSVLDAVGHNRNARPLVRLTRKGAVNRTFHAEPAPDQAHAHYAPISLAQMAATSTGRGSAGLHPRASRRPGGGTNHTGYMTKGRIQAKEMSAIRWMRGVRMTRDSRTMTSWEIPESLGEEFAWVGQKFPQVSFENINVAQRTCLLALNGPWGSNGEPVFLRIHAEFSPEYPARQPPTFSLDSSDISEEQESHDRLITSLNKIAQAHLAKQRPCLDACILFLLGKADFNTLGEWVIPDDDLVYPSDDDGDDSSGDSMNEFENTVYMPGESVRQHDTLSSQNVPLPKRCAALFCGVDTLLCFFPARDEHPAKSLLSLDAFNYNPRRAFQAFDFLDGADDSFDESSSSDDSSSGGLSTEESLTISGGGVAAAVGIGAGAAQYDRRKMTNRSSSRTGYSGGYSDVTSHRRGAGPKAGSSNVSGSKISLSWYSTRGLEVTNHVLAQEYRVSGPSIETCEYNASIARRHGYIDQAQTWELLDILLSQRVPRSLPEYDLRVNSLMVYIKNSFLQHGPSKQLQVLLMARSSWGFSPIAHWLVEEIFEYYEQQKNQQMLAMLSCILYEEATTLSELQDLIEPRGDDIMSLVDPKLTLSNFLDDSIVRPYDADQLKRADSQMDLSEADDYITAGSNNSAATSPMPPASLQDVELAPPSGNSRPSSILDFDQRSGIFAGRSPEQERMHMSLMRPKPASTKITPKGRGFLLRNVNKGLFDEDEAAPILVPMLTPKRQKRCIKYREAYAETLYRYGLVLRRLELLKFNGPSLKKRGDMFEHDGPVVYVGCSVCGTRCHGAYCSPCRSKLSSLTCAVCELSVNGLCSSCPKCLHGCHTACLFHWYSKGSDTCPANGCTCDCVNRKIPQS